MQRTTIENLTQDFFRHLLDRRVHDDEMRGGGLAELKDFSGRSDLRIFIRILIIVMTSACICRKIEMLHIPDFLDMKPPDSNV